MPPNIIQIESDTQEANRNSKLIHTKKLTSVQVLLNSMQINYYNLNKK